ncbi:protein kinase C-like protein [Pneumocystis murina B123]|uniref:protein kinase C n=1 Tax=Pneumocystis murina (strain B123) TaxID=1069680 RepID=M7NRC8_PNEMU|nr:protein kinase C-like protein [Pneumocystis murina B123]EMR11268.1 protein kinase C-like protein [Pneumocystis murina B123]
MEDILEAINDIHSRIEREKVLIQGAQAMRGQTVNENVQQSLENNIRESQRNITYLEERMRELQLRREEYLDGEYNERDDDNPPTPPPKNIPFLENSKMMNNFFLSNTENNEKSEVTLKFAMPLKLKPQYTKLDLYKYYTPYTSWKIQTMMQQLESKLMVEKQVKNGFDKLIKLYENENDKKNKNEAEVRKVESEQKIQLLKRALKRYKNLNVDIDKEIQENNESRNVSSMRGSLSGVLKGKIYAIQDIEHVSRTFRTPEIYVVIKVDKTEFSTRVSKTDRWLQESFEIEANKANEIEFTVYDKYGNSSIPVAVLYIQISDINEELRQNRLKEASGPDWVSAENMQNDFGEIKSRENIFDIANSNSFLLTSEKQPYTMKKDGTENKSIDAWFALEPAGKIHLSLNFVKNLKKIRTIDRVGLGRQGAIREKKKELYEMNGHKFSQHQFYRIIKCALCSEFLKDAAGFRCIECRYTCHKKCYLKVVSKCISKPSYVDDSDEKKLNHHIPHRFESIVNIGANWCCHCGYILPLGKRNAQKCTECNILCHFQCRHLIPNLCGMSMEVANKILNEIKITKMKQANTFVAIDKKDDNFRKFHAETTDNLLSINESYLNDNQSKTQLLSQNLSQFLVKSFQNDEEFKFENEQISLDKISSQKNLLDIIDTRETHKSQLSLSSSIDFQKGILSSDLDLSFDSLYQKNHQHKDQIYKQENYGKLDKSTASEQERHTDIVHKTSDKYSSDYDRYSNDYDQYSEGIYGKQNKYNYSPDSSIKNYQFFNDTHIDKSTSCQASRTRISSFSKKKVGLDDFNFLSVLGKGNFGKVMLAEAKSTKQLYAIKILKKESIIENEEIGSTISEKRIFLTANKGRHPFLINLHSCFQTETRIYFVMEYVSGGDLLLHIQREQFGQTRALFYAAEVLLVLKHLHENGIIYRDLKLDNILLCLDGHIKVTDYGLCKEDMWYGSTTTTFCGTPEFMAPEILFEQRYGRAVDWWAFGVLIYQMLLGQSPFRGEDEDEIFDSIQSDEPLYPIHMPRDSVSILQRLLIKEPEQRLGSGPGDALEVMAHPFFRNINWDDIYHKRVHPPYFPKITNPMDTSNFDTEFTHEPPVLTPTQSKLTQAMQEQFRGFSIYCGDP